MNARVLYGSAALGGLIAGIVTAVAWRLGDNAAAAAASTQQDWLLPAVAATAALTPPAPAPFNPAEATVRIETPNGHGSGVVIAPGLVLTAKHVIDKAESIKVGEKGARVLWTNGKRGDIALMAVDTEGRRPAAPPRSTAPRLCKAMRS